MSENPSLYEKGHPDDLEWPLEVSLFPVTPRYRVISGPKLLVKDNDVVVETLRFPKVYEFHLQILNANIAYELGRIRRHEWDKITPHDMKKLFFAIQLREKFVEELRVAQDVQSSDLTKWRSKTLDPVIHRAFYGMENTPHYRKQYAEYCKKCKIIPYQQDILHLGVF